MRPNRFVLGGEDAEMSLDHMLTAEGRYVRQPENRRAAVCVPGQLDGELEHDREQTETRPADEGHQDVQDYVVVGFDCGLFHRSRRS